MAFNSISFISPKFRGITGKLEKTTHDTFSTIHHCIGAKDFFMEFLQRSRRLQERLYAAIA